MYRLLYRAVLRRLPAETAHRAGFWLICAVAVVPGAAWGLRRWLGPRDPVLRVRALGLDFPGPLGLAAGFDKDARGTAGLGALGFGFVEVGTVTARPQPGNDRPRMFRLPADRALINRMGFNNAGAAAAAARLRRHGGRRRFGFRTIVGVNIGKTRVVPEEQAAADYAASARAVAGVADYVVVNVSSPNTPGLRDLQAADRLRPVLTAVRSALDEGAAGGRSKGPKGSKGSTALWPRQSRRQSRRRGLAASPSSSRTQSAFNFLQARRTMRASSHPSENRDICVSP